MNAATFTIGVIAMSLVAAACAGGGGSLRAPLGAGDRGSSPGIESMAPLTLVRGPVSPDGLQMTLATPDLGVGTHRFGFFLTSVEGFLLLPVADLTLHYTGHGRKGGVAATAQNHIWPFGIRGLFATELTFDRPGVWSVDIVVHDTDGAIKRAELAFRVPEIPSAPPVGSAAVASNTKTLAEVADVAQLSTGSIHDPDFYRLRLADAIVSRKPTVFVIASPAFCTSATCGPILETLKMLKDRFGAEANFVHADFFDNPGEIQGDLSKARISSTALEWGVNNGEWTFVIDRRGMVSHKFEGYATFAELEQALTEVL